MTNVRVDALDADHARVEFCITAYRGDRSKPLAGGGLAGALFMLVSVSATLERQEGQWLFASQVTTREFTFPD